MIRMLLFTLFSSSIHAIRAIRAFRSASRISQSDFRSATRTSSGRGWAVAIILAGKTCKTQGGTIGTKVASMTGASGSSTGVISAEFTLATKLSELARLAKLAGSLELRFSGLLTRLAGADFFGQDLCFVADLLTSSRG